MATTATLAIQIISDATKAAKGFQQASQQTSKLEKGMATANRVAVATTGALLAVGAASLKQASQLQQSTGAVEATFGRQAKAVQDLSKKAAESVGLSRASYQELASTFGAQLKNMGVAAADLVPQTDSLISLGADLAATYGGTTSDAVAALSSLLRGERDPIERYGVAIKQADINAVLASKGQDKLTGAAKRQAETQATLALLTKQTSDVQGQFAKESDSAAGAAQIMQAKLDDMGASLGTVLLPAASAAAGALAGLADFVSKHNTEAQIALGVIAGLAAAVFAVNAAIRVYQATVVVITAVTKAWAAVQKVLNIVMRANPIGLVITAVALLVAGIVLAYKRSSTFRTIVQAAMTAAKVAVTAVVTAVVTLYNWLKGSLSTIWNTVKTKAQSAWDAIVDKIQPVIDAVQDLIDRIRNINWPTPPAWVRNAGGALADLLGSYHDFGLAAGAGYAYAPAVFAGPGTLKAAGPESIVGRVGGRGGAAYVQIIVQGAIDPVSTAQQIEKLLRRQGIRMGAAV